MNKGKSCQKEDGDARAFLEFTAGRARPACSLRLLGRKDQDRFTATLRRSGLSFLAEKGRRVKSQCLLCVMGFFLSDQSANHRSCHFGELRTDWGFRLR